ncbi:MAG TPA: hypothetical protein VHB79_17000 [Polyangiaceae bacterium]|nr:hypothetical protein [Polyangiaceae bacterium]
MKEMSREANELVSAGRQAFRPTEADRARLMAALAGGATLTVTGAAAAGALRPLRWILGASHGLRALAIALPVAAAGSYWWQASGRSAATPIVQPVSQPPAAVVERSAISAVEVVEERAVLNPAPALPERSASPAFESPKPANGIREEVALLSKAQAALSRGRPQEALEALSEHAQRFPRGALTEERAATKARTLCALGRRQEAEGELKYIEKLNPTSAYLARARESCRAR